MNHADGRRSWSLTRSPSATGSNEEGRLSAADDNPGRAQDAVVVQAVALVNAWAQKPGQSFTQVMTRSVDRHGLERIPGHRTTPIVAAVVAAAGATMPHFSLRSGAGAWSSADVMATLTGVQIDRATAAGIAKCVGLCIAQADAAGLSTSGPWSPTADDAHQVASALSRRVAVGVRSLLLTAAVGRGAGVADDERFHRLKALFTAVGRAVGVQVRVARWAGTQPVGLGIGPALEALDVLAVLRGAAAAPVDLRMHALSEAGQLLELCGASPPGQGELDAWRVLDSGAAWARFQTACEAQGGMREPRLAPFTETLSAGRAGHARALDGARVRRAAVLAGTPRAAGAGVLLHTRIGDRVERGQALFTVHAASRQCLAAVMDEQRRAPLIGVDDAASAAVAAPRDRHLGN